MEIWHNITFNLRAYGKDRDKYQIRMRVTFNGQQIDIATGSTLVSKEAWNPVEELVIPGYVSPKGVTALIVNNNINNHRYQMEMSFKYFEANDIYPSGKELSDKFAERISRFKPQKPCIKDRHRKSGENTFFEVFRLFLAECGEKNSWTEATFNKMASLKEDLMAFKKDIKFSDLDESGLTAFVKYLREDKRLKTPRKKKGNRAGYDADDLIGLKNSTIGKKLGYLRWFLNWATEKGYNPVLAFRSFRPALKSTQKKVIYLTKEELARVKDLELPEGKEYLDPVRDVFLFCCFTGLRHSDAYLLRRNDVKEDHIEVTTVKTADSLSIELNDISKAILDKYRNAPIKGNHALPFYTNQTMNRDIKEICMLAQINEEIRVTTYKGNERRDEVHQKWELVGTHTGRRTFIVNALSLGIPPNVVMKWTGHNDYKSMKPYIDIVDSIKATSMKKFNGLI